MRYGERTGRLLAGFSRSLEPSSPSRGQGLSATDVDFLGADDMASRTLPTGVAGMGVFAAEFMKGASTGPTIGRSS